MATDVPSPQPVTRGDDRSALPPGSLAARAGTWATLAACAAALPLLPAFTGGRVFYIRDLSLSFWGRYLWLRRTLLSGEWPIWDPYVAGGQAAAADALNQVFLLPSLLVRLIGSEAIGFNLWVALPFPLAALGAWFFFARRFSAPAAALGAIAFALSGPVFATANFPNMSWSVAALPWVLWAVDRVASAPSPRRVAALAIAVACQALAGEPVTLLATLALAVGFALLAGAPAAAATAMRLRHAAWVAAGIALGMLLAAVQLLPLAQAARQSPRTDSIAADFWSLHPMALLETVSPHLFGEYFTSQSLAPLPWMPLLNSGREPFFFSLYFGVPLFALALFGLIAGRPRRWPLFWLAAGALALIGAFGSYTPIYPFLQDHLPVLRSFRFPAKYIVITAMAIAAGAAAGWDAIAARYDAAVVDPWFRRARIGAIALALTIGAVAYLAAAACLYFATPAAFRFFAFARSLDARDPVLAAEFMLHTLPRHATSVLLMSLGAAAAIFLGTGAKRLAPAARAALYLFIAGDLIVRAWGVNPSFDAKYVAEPVWLAATRTQPGARIYVGGKHHGTLDAGDLDSSRGYLNPPGLTGSASRAALNIEAAFYPSAWRGREMLSYDLAVLWPRVFAATHNRFLQSGREARDRFLDRTGVRYRILPGRAALGRTAVMKIPYFLESYLFDWGDNVAPRAAVVADARIEPDQTRQIAALFEPGWDSRTTAMIDRETAAAGQPGGPLPPSARLTADATTLVAVDAAAGAAGGYLVLLDAYSEDWHAAVDGRAAEVVRANGLFRAVRLAPGRHVVEFMYRPRALIWGAGISAAALIVVFGLMMMGDRRRSG